MAKSHSNSENESNGKINKPSHNSNNNSNGNSNKFSNQQQYLKDLLNRHINNNHPKLFSSMENTAPLELSNYDDEFLRRYKDHYHLKTLDNSTLAGFLLQSPVGELTYTGSVYNNNNNNTASHGKKQHAPARSSREELVKSCQEHLDNVQVKELELIPQFIYKVRKQKSKFKMEFS